MLNFWRHHKLLILWLAVTIYLLTFFYFTWAKLHNFGYDNLDLAIFNNSLFNLTQGFGLANSIHPPSYWGDHASPILYLLAPLYALAPTPLTLLWLQVLLLAACVWPLYLIARKKVTQTKTIIVCLLWLVNPVMNNMTMFEFSLVPCAIFFLLWSWHWYEKKLFWLWLLFALLALSCREDIAFVILMYSVVAWIDKRGWGWRLVSTIISLGWFVIAQNIIQHYVLSGNYKFSIYYLWLNESSTWDIILHFVTWPTVELVLGLLFPVFFLALWRPKLLLFLLGPLGSITLTHSGGGQLVLKSHYGGLLLWPIFLALIMWLQTGQVIKKFRAVFPQWFFIYGLLILASTYASLTYGSFLPQLLHQADPARTQAYAGAMSMIPKESGVAATYSFLSNLSSRRTLQLLPYAYAGRGQFALTDYQLNPNVDYLAIDWQEMIYAQGHYPSRYPRRVTHQTMLSQWQKITKDFQPMWQQGNIMIMRRQSSDPPLATVQPSNATELTMKTGLHVDSNLTVTIDGPLPPTEVYLQAKQGNQVWRWPLAYGLYEPTASTNSLSISMMINIPQVQQSPITLQLYSWKEARLNLSAVNSLSAQWPDQTLLLEQNLSPDTDRTDR